MICEGIFTFLQRIMFFTAFISDRGCFPRPLDKDEERILFEKMQAGDTAAREKLIRHNLRLVAHVVKKYSGAAEADDMISVGSIGLIKAINTYSFDKGTQLATYAAKCIDNEILMYIRATKRHRYVASLTESVGKDREGGDITLADMLQSDDEDVDVQVERNILASKALSILPHVLDKREQQIVRMRYGIGCDPMAQREVAAKLGISRSYVSRIEKKALYELKKALEART